MACLAGTQVVERVLTTIDMRGEENGAIYFEDLYRSAQIYDELVLLLPAAGGVWVALCLSKVELIGRSCRTVFWQRD